MAKRRTFVAALISLVCAFVLVFSLGLMTACGNDETASGGSETAETVGGAWYYGAAVPSDSLGVVGDYYLNTKTLSSYKKTEAGWMAVNTDGGEWLYGQGVPTDGGNVNDFYLDVDSGDLYHKSESGWGEPVLKLFGKNGRDGVIWFSGEGEPQNGPFAPQDALPGDFYLDYGKKDGKQNFDVWQYVEKEGVLTWENLGSIKGKDAETPLQFFNGNGEPSEEITAKAHEGDLYLGQFSGLEEEGALAGSKLYRYINHEWVPLMESMQADVIHIYNYEQLVAFRESVATRDYAGMVIRLKTNIDFESTGTEAISLLTSGDATPWTPIGTKEHPFKGIFDGEGHTISNLNVEGTTAGLFGATEDATIRNLTIKSASVTAAKAAEGKSAAGILVGSAKGDLTIQNVNIETSSVNVPEEAAGAYVGALVGETDGNISAREVDATVDTTVTKDGEETTTSSSLVGYIPYGNELDTDESVEVKGEAGETKDLSCLQTGLHDYDPLTETCKNCGSMHPFVEGSGYLSTEGKIKGAPNGVTELVIPGVVNGKPAELAENAFKGKNLTSVTISEGAKSVADSAFQDCSSLTSVTLPSTLESIGNKAFASCTQLTQVELPEGLKTIGQFAFSGDGTLGSSPRTALTSVTIPSTVTNIGEGAFYNLRSLTKVEFKDGVQVIEKNSFNRSKIESLDIPGSVTTIGEAAFYTDLKTVKSLTLHEGLLDIGANAFGNLQVEELTIPDSVTTIRSGAFNGASELKHVLIGTGVQGDSSGFDLCTKTCVFEYKEGATTVTKLFSSLIYQFEVTTKELYDAMESTNHIMVVLPDSITTIGQSAFSQRSQLLSVTLPKNVQTICAQAFYNCTNLKSIIIPDSVTRIGTNKNDYSPFYGCKALEWVVLPAGLETFYGHYGSSENEQFKGCGEVSVYFKGTRAQWGEKAFAENIKANESVKVYCTGEDGELGWDGNVENLPK